VRELSSELAMQDGTRLPVARPVVYFWFSVPAADFDAAVASFEKLGPVSVVAYCVETSLHHLSESRVDTGHG